MSRRLAVLFTLFLAFSLALPAAAQDDELVDPEEMEGLEQAYARMYVVPALMAPDTSRINFEKMGEETSMMALLGVFVFEDDDAAEENLQYFAAGFMGETFAVDDYDEEEVDDLGDEAYLYTAETDFFDVGTDDLTFEVSLLVVREDEVVYFATAVAGDSEDSSREFVEFMMDGEIGDPDDVEFSEDGTSTGGGFDTMPEEDHDLLGDMEPAYDIQLSEEDMAS